MSGAAAPVMRIAMPPQFSSLQHGGSRSTAVMKKTIESRKLALTDVPQSRTLRDILE